jgi:coenzyme F420-reducing hydrogenase gamma subunit
MKIKKPIIGVYGVSGCSGCLLSLLFEDCFKELIKLVDLKSFPLIKEERYKGKFDYIFVEGTVCFDEDILTINELRRKTKYLVALGSCACFGGVPSIKLFLDSDKTMKLIYPVYNHLKPEPPTPIDFHVKVDYYLPQCPPNKQEILEFIKFICTNREFKPYREPVCYECRRKSNLCLLTKNQICLGPVSNGGCDALCPTNAVTCYGCRGACKDANFKAFRKMLESMGYTEKSLHDKIQTFSGLQFKELEENKSEWLER